MHIPGLGQLPHARSVTMQVMQGFCKKDDAFLSKNSENIANLGREVAGRMEFTKTMYYSLCIHLSSLDAIQNIVTCTNKSNSFICQEDEDSTTLFKVVAVSFATHKVIMIPDS